VNKKTKVIGISLAVLWFFGLLAWYLHRSNIAVLNTRGIIAHQEKRLMITTVLLGMIVIVPVYFMAFLFAWRYRESNTKATYNPNLTGNVLAETVWWGIPTTIILILSIITWQTSHSLDPRRRLVSSQQPLTIQVIALDWKWLFLYPSQGVASINYVELPVGRPVTFQITSDAPMNSFWIPQLGSQIYAMPGMSSQLNLEADRAGDYNGSSANISGRGFAGMRFIAHAAGEHDFTNWFRIARTSNVSLDRMGYDQFAKPSEDAPVTTARYNPTTNIYQSVLLKYLAPGGQ
jgi:cytochrome o ubiquinol oxidase subunit 2